MSKMICREGLANREYVLMHTHTCANAQACTCTCTQAHTCGTIPARGDANTVVSNGFHQVRAFCSFLVRGHYCLSDQIHADLTRSLRLPGLLPSPSTFSPSCPSFCSCLGWGTGCHSRLHLDLLALGAKHVSVDVWT